MKHVLIAAWLAATLTAFLEVQAARAQPRVRIVYRTGQARSLTHTVRSLPQWSRVMMLIAPMLAALFTWPIFRAWCHVLCGNYEAAIRIYEKRLAENPAHLRLYLTLANLYLLAGRRDARAVTAYAMMRLLHSACNNAYKDGAHIRAG